MHGSREATPWQDGTETISTQKVSPAHEMILASFKAKVLPRLGPGASTEGTILRRILRWSTEGVHMAPDAKHVENLASLLEVKGAKPSPTTSPRATGRGQRDVLELLAAAEATGVPQRHGDCPVSRTRQVRSAVCDEGARSRHADAKQVVDAEGQTVCQVSPRCGRRGTVLRVLGLATHGVGLD